MNEIICPESLLGLNRRVKVALVGAGGTGGSCATLLFKLNTVLKKLGGYGLDVTIYDPKKVSGANIGRQPYWNSCDEGHYKSRLLVNRFNQFGNVNWSFSTEKFNGIDAVEIDLLITTVDSAKARLEIAHGIKDINHRRKPKALWLDLGNASTVGQAFLGSLYGYSDEFKLVSPHDIFGSSWSDSVANDAEVSKPSCSTDEAITKQSFGVNDVLATNAFAMLIFPLIRRGKIKNHGFRFDLLECVTEPIAVDPFVWQMYGFNPDSKAA